MSVILNNLPTTLNVGSRTFKLQSIRKAFQKLMLGFKIRRCLLLIFFAIVLVLVLLIVVVNSSKEQKVEEVKPQPQKRLYNMNLDKIDRLVSIAEKYDQGGEDAEVLQDLLKTKDKASINSKLLSFFNNHLGNNVEFFAQLKEQPQKSSESR